ncbi:amidophosphoribosyltransferase [Halobacteriovorax marinus]|uniref:amidophosphoribosyltransferase n=1 Tax=Halobacteriovorax marinus TaxID=97084 RepID=UPI000BDF7849|nr:amidophosphoribosyltransferase [Halobacteriovorax marinus]
MEKVRMCGVTAILHSKTSSNESLNADATYDVYRSLLKLQHRGQDAAGIVAYNSSEKRFHSHRSIGLVNDIFNESNIALMKGDMAIGHTRYATTGSDSLNDIQPLLTGYPLGLALAHNGNIVNYHDLAREINSKSSAQLLTNNDIELFQNIWCQSFSVCKDNSLAALIDGSRRIFNDLKGAYALVGILGERGVFGLRDPYGIRPLCLGMRESDGRKSWILCSETSSLIQLGFDYIRDISPGELVFIDRDGEIFSRVLVDQKRPSTCMFEWVYFSAAESSIENRDVYSVRLALGTLLANQIKRKYGNILNHFDIVCPVPDTSRTAAIALAETLNLPYREGLIKNRYSQRSFILSSDQQRQRAIENKLTPIISEIKDKNILLVDDSIVRGTTSRRIISLLKMYGAKSVTMAITCPPIKYGCFYGVDFPDTSSLIASNKTISEIELEVGAKAIEYLTIDNLEESISHKGICDACLSGQYPTDISASEEFSKRRSELRI